MRFALPAIWMPSGPAMAPDESWIARPWMRLLLVLSASACVVLTASMTAPGTAGVAAEAGLDPGCE